MGQSLSSCFGCVSESKKESQKNSTKFEEDDSFEIADFPKDFETCPSCGFSIMHTYFCIEKPH